MTAHPQTNSSIAAARSAADIPPQRGQPIPLLSFAHLTRGGLCTIRPAQGPRGREHRKAMDCSKHHRLIQEDRTEALVHVGVGWSGMWELSDTVATRESRGAKGVSP